ncbi:dynein regulatory complex subunit 4 [Austrofundulus limnaeus]|uniref:Dynein regulatory complex subunit 4 n=1 Tax=Austrofundulus limnaeus TaxID=52670 RepID=A0A2I4D6K9_AUSLI|nr:PREDICTED: growth arrest-specific protein 8-like [Austrofundulus limnaeus]
MPPKTKQKKGRKGKLSEETNRFTTEEMSKDQLEEHIVLLREELDREREERSYFQLERDKIRAFWEVSKRDLEESEAQLRNRVRERDEAEERHRVEITVYKQKLKQVLSEEHDTVSEMKMDALSSSSLVQNQNTESQVRLHRDVQNLQADYRDKKIQEDRSIKELKQMQQVELMKMSREYERRLREVEQRFHHRMQTLTEEEEKRRRSALMEVEDRMKSREDSLIQDQDRALRRAEEFYSGVHDKQLKELNQLKEERVQLQNQEVQLNKELSAAQQENQHLTQVLQEAREELVQLQRQLQDQNRAKDLLLEHRSQMKLVEKQLRDLTVEHQLLLQASHKVQEERDELLRRQKESLLEVQQRSGLKKLLLEEKLAALTETLEQKEAQLNAARSVCSSDPLERSTAATKLQETLESKRVAVQVLKDHLSQEAQDYDQLLQDLQNHPADPEPEPEPEL